MVYVSFSKNWCDPRKKKMHGLSEHGDAALNRIHYHAFFLKVKITCKMTKNRQFLSYTFEK